MTTLVLLGEFARLPCVYMLRGVEESLSPLAQTHPFFALLADSEAFFTHFGTYRDDLAAFIQATIEPSLGPADLRHMLNLIHTICFLPEMEGGPMEHTVQALFDPSMRWTVAPPAPPEFRKVGWYDSTVRSARRGRRYVWRREVLHAEPADEILITPDERARVTRALEDYEIAILG